MRKQISRNFLEQRGLPIGLEVRDAVKPGTARGKVTGDAVGRLKSIATDKRTVFYRIFGPRSPPSTQRTPIQPNSKHAASVQIHSANHKSTQSHSVKVLDADLTNNGRVSVRPSQSRVTDLIGTRPTPSLVFAALACLGPHTLMRLPDKK